MAEKSTWVLELIYTDGEKLLIPVRKEDADWIFEKGDGDTEIRVHKLLKGTWKSLSFTEVKTAVSFVDLRSIRAYEQKGNPLNDASHYDDPLS